MSNLITVFNEQLSERTDGFAMNEFPITNGMDLNDLSEYISNVNVDVDSAEYDPDRDGVDIQNVGLLDNLIGWKGFVGMAMFFVIYKIGVDSLKGVV